MSNADKSRRLARTWARILGSSAGADAVVDFASGGGACEPAPSSAEMLATIAPGQADWDEGAINARAAQVDGCPAGCEGVYYAAYAAEARATVVRLAGASS